MKKPTMSDLLDLIRRLREAMAKEGVDLSIDIKVKQLNPAASKEAGERAMRYQQKIDKRGY